jgi:hypothetical protein
LFLTSAQTRAELDRQRNQTAEMVDALTGRCTKLRSDLDALNKSLANTVARSDYDRLLSSALSFITSTSTAWIHSLRAASTLKRRGVEIQVLLGPMAQFLHEQRGKIKEVTPHSPPSP